MKRVLFVDDESNILSGLQRMLRSQRDTWEMVFAESGAMALEAMEAEAFDVVVTDMKMPGMDGAELLKQVHQRHPRTVRIVLSGHADLEASMRSTGVSHQFMAKPCDADALRGVVERACSLESLLREPSLRKAIGTITELPVLPRTYQALTTALGNEEVNLQEVGAIVEQDVGITAKILQLVNSSYFGLRAQVSSVSQATNYLGVATIRDLVLSFEMFRQFEGGGFPPGFSIEAEQAHSMLTARIARRLLEDKAGSDMAFLAALLHDVGTLIMATSLAEQYAAILKKNRDGRQPIHLAEQEKLGVSHAELGAYLLGLWGMPYPIVEAVAHHHHPSRVEGQREFGVLGAIHVADALAHEVSASPEDAPSIDEAYLLALGVAGRMSEWRKLAETEAGCGIEAA